jgi:hypothetical protein
MIRWGELLMSYNQQIKEKLINMGFNGGFLGELLKIIKDDDDYEKFQNFIINNDGKFDTQLHLIHQFSIYLQQTSPYTKEEFIQEYKNASNKYEVIVKLFKSSVNPITLKKIERLFKNGLTLEEFYDKVVMYRGSFNAENIVNMIELNI